MKPWSGALLAAAALAGLGAMLWPDAAPMPSRADAAPMLAAPSSPTPVAESPAAATAAVAASAAAVASPVAPAETPTPAHWSMADARERGDERTPPLQRAPALPAPDAWELSDHAAYARREADLRARARVDYVRAADTHLPELAEGIARGRAAGVPPEAIAKMEAKLQRLQALRDELARQEVNPP